MISSGSRKATVTFVSGSLPWLASVSVTLSSSRFICSETATAGNFFGLTRSLPLVTTRSIFSGMASVCGSLTRVFPSAVAGVTAAQSGVSEPSAAGVGPARRKIARLPSTRFSIRVCCAA